MLKEILADKTLIKYGLCMILGAALLYTLYFLIKNTGHIFAFLGSALSGLCSALSPLLTGLVIAYLLSPAVDFIAKRLAFRSAKLCRSLSIFLTYLFVLAAVIALIYGFATMIVGEFIAEDLDTALENVLLYFRDTDALTEKLAAGLPEGFAADHAGEFINFLMSWFSERSDAANAAAAAKNAAGGLFSFFIGIILSIYLIADKEFFFRLWRKFRHLVLPHRTGAVVGEALSEINRVVGKFVRGALLDALIFTVLASTALYAAGLDFAVLVGCFAGVSNIIPYFGPILGITLAFFVGALTGDLFSGLLSAAVLLILQQLDTNLIYPKVVGTSTGLHPLFVLVAVSVAARYGGLSGMLAAVPLAAILRIFIVKWAESAAQKRP